MDEPTFTFEFNASREREIQSIINYNVHEMGRYQATNTWVTELRTTNAGRKHHWRSILDRMDELNNLPPPAEIPLAPIFTAVSAWPEVLSIEQHDDAVIVTFLPVIIDGTPTSLLPIAIYGDGDPLGDGVTICHPHITEDNICTGNAGLALQLARSNLDLLGMITILRQMIQGYNRHSELNSSWRSDSKSWWLDNIYGKADYGGWNCHSVLVPETGEVKYIEQVFGQSMRQILNNWSSAIEDEDEEDEHDNCIHCDRCGSCRADDEYTGCSHGCGYYCDDGCIEIHMRREHEAYPCEGQENNWQHDDGSAFVDKQCSCSLYICNDCMDDHLETSSCHEDDEHKEEVNPAAEIPSPLPGQTPLFCTNERHRTPCPQPCSTCKEWCQPETTGANS